MNTPSNQQGPPALSLKRLCSLLFWDPAGFLQYLRDLIGLAAAVPKEQGDQQIRDGVALIVAAEERQIAELLVSARAARERAAATAASKEEERRSTPERLAGGDDRLALPRGFDRFLWFLCLLLAVVVTVGDGFNAAYLAARELQSWLAGAAFLIPALLAPLLPKLAVSRLPARARPWAELAIALFGVFAAGFFITQFVEVFTNAPATDPLALAGSQPPGMKHLYLAVLILGFCVVYALLSAALALMRPGLTEHDNPRYGSLLAELARARAELALAEVAVTVAEEEQAPRKAELQKIQTFLVTFGQAAADSRRSQTAAEAELKTAKAQAKCDLAGEHWGVFGSLLEGGNGANGSHAASLPPGRL